MSTTQDPSQVSQFDLERTPGEGGLGEAAAAYWERIKGGDLGSLPAILGVIVLVIVFGALGYLMKKLGFDPGPLVLAFVLGSLLEDSLRRSLLIFDGDATGFLTRPISGALLALFLLVALLPVLRSVLPRRRTASRTSETKETV